MFNEIFRMSELSGLRKIPRRKELDTYHENILIRYIGKDAIDYAKQYGAIVQIAYRSDGYLFFTISCHRKVIEIFLGEQKKSVVICFVDEVDFGKETKGQRFNGVFEKVGNTLQKGAIDFEKFLIQLIFRIDADCEIVVHPTSPQRERIYRHFRERYKKYNLTILP